MTPSLSLRLLQTQSDVRLLELARGGHERAFEALVQRYRKPLLNYCRRLLLPAARAEDALQQGLLQAWLALRDGAEVRDAKAWLYRIVHNAAISAVRRSGYDYVELDESLHGGHAPESDLDRRIAVREALAGIAALPEAQREVLLRTAVQGHSHEQVAAALGMTDGAVRGLIYRARATLRASASALTPPQIVLWAARAAEDGASHAQFAEITAGGGSAGLAGLLLKGGVVVMSAGALATGATLVQHAGGSGSSAQAAPAANLGHHRSLVRSPRSIDTSGLLSVSSSFATTVGTVKHRHGTGDRRRLGHRSGDDRQGSLSDLHTDGGSSSSIGGSDDPSVGGPGPSGSGGNDRLGDGHGSGGSSSSGGDNRSSGGSPSGADSGSGGGSDHEEGPSPGGSGGGARSGSGGGGPGKRDPAPADESASPEVVLGTDGASGGPGGSTSESKDGDDSSGESEDSSTRAPGH